MNQLESIEAIEDPMQRARKVHTVIEDLQGQVLKLSAIRREALNELVAQGLSITKIAEEIGISRSRVSQLRSAGLRPERVFFGSGRVTVAIGTKPERGRSDGHEQPLISREASQAYELIADTMRSLGLEAVQEAVPLSGLFDLNRENLVVLCSVKLMPFLSQVMVADSNLSFDTDDSGLFLVDRNTETEYRSPRDNGELRDFGYVGRLPSPGGKGTFLYAAGIHAEGTLGAAQWLTENAADLHKKLKLQRFSTLVESTFDESGKILSTQQLTALYREGK
ncbi:sigma-70 family RNA polymerase sigma factor [Glycomyces dulcitolivorans]|uniref:sigma-70 family RNA polymerase sigma factor n=1 Tax=Glycomyces dulcitolivorans TaxID=2200759 RepID=UPI000DD30009|nr:sigma-70 family RNA polymerase sigma factor [Glycomyces dulcitolivorans]